MTDLPEEKETLWIIAASPLIWSVHFLLCYATAAVWCAKVAGVGGSLYGARVAMGIYTVIALAGIGAIGWTGWRRHKTGTATVPHDFDTPQDRHRFLGFATVLLSALSGVGTLFVAFAIVFIGSCI